LNNFWSNQGDGELGVRMLCGITINVVSSISVHNQSNSELLEISARSEAAP
jgi:hypothetical protein